MGDNRPQRSVGPVAMATGGDLDKGTPRKRHAYVADIRRGFCYSDWLERGLMALSRASLRNLTSFTLHRNGNCGGVYNGLRGGIQLHALTLLY